MNPIATVTTEVMITATSSCRWSRLPIVSEKNAVRPMPTTGTPEPSIHTVRVAHDAGAPAGGAVAGGEGPARPPAAARTRRRGTRRSRRAVRRTRAGASMAMKRVSYRPYNAVSTAIPTPHSVRFATAIRHGIRNALRWSVRSGSLAMAQRSCLTVRA